MLFLTLTAGQQMPGVILHAHAVSPLIRFGSGEARPMAFLSDWGEAWWVLAWSLAGDLSARRARSTWRSVSVVAAGVGVLIVVSLALFANDWWIPDIPPAFAWLVSAAIVTASEQSPSIGCSEKRNGPATPPGNEPKLCEIAHVRARIRDMMKIADRKPRAIHRC